MTKHGLSELVDIPALRKLLDNLYEATVIPTAVLAPDETILTASGWQDICTKFHRVCQETEQLCIESDSFIKEHLHEGPFIGYLCKNGLMDYACPIMVEGNHLATLFAGQFFHTAPDEGFFRDRARRCSFDESAYMEALRRVPVIDESRIGHFMAFLSGIANMLSETGLRRLQELRQKDVDLARSEQRYRSLVKALTSVVWTTDAEGKFVVPQESWQAYTGQGWEEHREYGWVQALHPDDRESTPAVWQRSGLQSPPYESHGRIWSASAREYRHYTARAVPILNDDGSVDEWVGTVIDIHDRKLAEEALKERTDAVESANKELAHFAYIASHDLREPLRKISSFAELLAKRYQGRIDEKADKYIHYVVDGAHRMQKLIDDLLTFSRISRAELATEPVSLESVLEITLNDLEKLLKETGGEVTHDPLPTVPANPTQMGQLIQNLIGNAVKFRGDQPPRVHVSAQMKNDKWLVCVRDNGIGLDMEHAEGIFGIFQRLHGRGEYGGTGIGLAVCRKIVERHGGRIWVESEPGKGSTFSFSLPAA